MQWLCKEVVGPGKITMISDQHLGIRGVFERPDFGWQESTGETVHRYCIQHIAQNVYKDCHMKKKILFLNKLQDIRNHASHKFINNIRPASHKFIRKTRIMQGNLPTYQVSNRRTRNNKNRNNQPAAAKEVSAEEFHYEELIPEQVAALHQEIWAQHLDEGLNRWGIMTNNGSESLNNVFRIARQFPVYVIVENTWHTCVEWFYKHREIVAAWEAQCLMFSQKIIELIKHRGDKGRTYDIIQLDWGINNYDVYNGNELIETVIFNGMKR
jgi:hypothetical protein